MISVNLTFETNRLAAPHPFSGATAHQTKSNAATTGAWKEPGECLMRP